MSGITSAPDGKPCSKCGTYRPLAEFHSHPAGRFGRHSHCKPCANEAQRESRVRNYSKEQKRRWQFKTRYGLSMEQVHKLHDDQDGKCALCAQALEGKRPCIDHCHNTKVIRGLLCHQCNIRLGGWDDIEWRTKAIKYMGITV